MAENLPSPVEQELLGLRTLLWGAEIKQDIFRRWSQGKIVFCSFFAVKRPDLLVLPAINV